MSSDITVGDYSKFINNKVTNDGYYGGGGAIYVTNSSTFSIGRAEFTGNYTGNYGGAVATMNGSNTTISNSTFTDNYTGNYGGAIHARLTPSDIILMGIFMVIVWVGQIHPSLKQWHPNVSLCLMIMFLIVLFCERMHFIINLRMM